MATFHIFDTSFRISHTKFRRNCLARSGDILLTNECISSSEAEKEEGWGSVSETATPHVIPCVFISGQFRHPIIKRHGSPWTPREHRISLKQDLQLKFRESSRNYHSINTPPSWVSLRSQTLTQKAGGLDVELEEEDLRH
jgi:hypothetical protein